jgi:hypothetical protein
MYRYIYKMFHNGRLIFIIKTTEHGLQFPPTRVHIVCMPEFTKDIHPQLQIYLEIEEII